MKRNQLVVQTHSKPETSKALNMCKFKLFKREHNKSAKYVVPTTKKNARNQSERLENLSVKLLQNYDFMPTSPKQSIKITSLNLKKKRRLKNVSHFKIELVDKNKSASKATHSRAKTMTKIPTHGSTIKNPEKQSINIESTDAFFKKSPNVSLFKTLAFKQSHKIM